MNDYLNKFSIHTLAQSPNPKLTSPMRICWSPLSYVRGPPLSPLVNQIITVSLMLPTHPTRILARLPPGAELAVLPGPHGHRALTRGHHRHTQLINDVPFTFILSVKKIPRGGLRTWSPGCLLFCPSRTPRRSSRRNCQYPRSGRDTPGCRCPSQPAAKPCNLNII